MIKVKDRLVSLQLLWLAIIGFAANADNMLRSDKPPGGLKVDTVPQFVSLGFDDVNDAAGIDWTLELLSNYQNPKGKGNADTFDGTKLLASFFPICNHAQRDPSILSRWHKIWQQGHEIGNHTNDHLMGQKLTVAQWQKQLEGCINRLTKPYKINNKTAGIGMKRWQIRGFRAPYLMYTDNTFSALKVVGTLYDVSVQEGLQPDRHSGNQYWPYTMDNGLEAAKHAYWRPQISAHTGLWVLPLHVLSVVPDDQTRQYGLYYSLKKKLAKRLKNYNTNAAKLTPFDHNLFSSDQWMYGLTKAEVLAVLKYNLDSRLKGNRAPMVIGLHSAYFNGKKIEHIKNTTAKERQQVLSEFLSYALSKHTVRVVRHVDIIEWMQSPKSF